MADGARVDPLTQFNFIIEIEGVAAGGFSECSGLTSDTNIIEYREGNDKLGTVHKQAGLIKYSNIVLKQGSTLNRSLWDWRKKVVDGKTERKGGSIVLLDEARQPALRWNFREGWPSKLEGPALNAKTSEVAVETLEIAHEGLEMA
jgi:phage tail-like protein